MYLCPVCGSKEVGKINTAKFFCRHCFVEFNTKQEIFAITEDGSLIVNGR